MRTYRRLALLSESLQRLTEVLFEYFEVNRQAAWKAVQARARSCFSNPGRSLGIRQSQNTTLAGGQYQSNYHESYRIDLSYRLAHQMHMCVEVHPTIALSEFMQVIKQETSYWMKAHRELFPYFEAWGNGYAAFTYSVKERPTVIEYIKNQKAHHAAKSFREEYEELLEEFGIDPSKDLFLKDE